MRLVLVCEPNTEMEECANQDISFSPLEIGFSSLLKMAEKCLNIYNRHIPILKEISCTMWPKCKRHSYSHGISRDLICILDTDLMTDYLQCSAHGTLTDFNVLCWVFRTRGAGRKPAWGIRSCISPYLRTKIISVLTVESFCLRSAFFREVNYNSVIFMLT